MTSKKSLSLRQYVFQNFFKAALLPLLFIECALVLLYFSINYYNHRNSSETLHIESFWHLKEIVANQSRILSKDFGSIRELASVVQRESEYFFKHPDLVPTVEELRGEYKFAPNGVYYRSDKTEDASSLYYSTVADIGQKEKEKALRSEVLDPVYKNVKDANSSIVAVYLNTHDSMNRYYPFIDEVYTQYLPDMNIPEFNFYYLADKKHNPEGGPVWTETYLDPAGQGWMMSCIVPVYNGEFLEGVAGIDMTVDVLLKSVLNLVLPWDAKPFLVDKSGTIMAMPGGVEKLFGLTELRKHVYEKQVAADTFKPEEFNLLKSSKEQIRDIASNLLETDFSVEELSIDGKNYYLAQATVAETGWKLMVVADRDIILEPIDAMDKRARKIGYLAIACMVVFYLLFFLYLLRNASGMARNIAVPAVDISEKSSHIAEGRYETVFGESNIVELDALSSSYSKMVREIQTLHQNLQEKIKTANLEIAEREQVQLALQQRERDLVEAKELAEAANRAKSRFLANTSHEIRTPMNAIIGFLQLARNTELTEQQQGYLLKINQSAESLLGILNDILDISKIEADKLEIENREFDLSEVMQNLSYTMATRAHEKELELIFDLSADLPRKLVGDPMRLGQVLLNLISNGIKFTEEGEIVVSVEQVETIGRVALLKFAVRDTGIGIPKDEQELLFQPFHQVDGSTSRRYGGTGLGLAICKKITQLMGGEIHVQSKAGEGAIFWFNVPFEMSGDGEAEERPIPDALAGLKVLVVDDNKTCLKVMTHFALQLGFVAESAPSGEKAIKMIVQADKEGKPFKLVLIDWRMPELDGVETCRKIRKESGLQELPKAILVSKFEMAGLDLPPSDDVLDGVMSKPVTQSLLYDKVLGVFGYEGIDRGNMVRRSGLLARGLEKIRGARILLVEDNDINQQVASELLRGEGFFVTITENGREGVEAVKNGSDDGFDIVLMDIQMPVMDGNSATREIRQDRRFKDLPIVAMTADAMSGVRESAIAAGMNDYITKPIVPDVLLKTLVKFVPPGERQLPGDYVAGKEKKAKEVQGMPEIAGVDVDSGINRIGGDVERYRQVLGKFCRSQVDAARKIAEEVASGNLEQAMMLAHSLQGSSGNVGAVELQKQAKHLEELLQEEKVAEIGGELERLSHILEDVLYRVSNSLKRDAKPYLEVKPQSINEDELLALMERLRELLLDSDTEAQNVLADIQQRVRGSRLEGGFARVAVHVEGYDDEAALEELDRISTEI